MASHLFCQTFFVVLASTRWVLLALSSICTLFKAVPSINLGNIKRNIIGNAESRTRGCWVSLPILLSMFLFSRSSLTSRASSSGKEGCHLPEPTTSKSIWPRLQQLSRKFQRFELQFFVETKFNESHSLKKPAYAG